MLRCRLAHLEAERAAAETAVVAASEALAAQQARPDTQNVEWEPAAAPDARLLDAVARVEEIEAACDDVARQLALLSGGGSVAPAGAGQPA